MPSDKAVIRYSSARLILVAVARAKQGIPIAIVDARQLKEGADVNPANGSLALFNKAPHPNAAKVYINWLLSKEGQTVFRAPTVM